MFQTISRLAALKQISVPAFYYWMKTGQIDSRFIDRSDGATRIDEEYLDSLLRSGKLMRRCGRKSVAVPCGPMSQASKTTHRDGVSHVHNWTNDSGGVSTEHPWGPCTVPLDVVADLLAIRGPKEETESHA